MAELIPTELAGSRSVPTRSLWSRMSGYRHRVDAFSLPAVLVLVVYVVLLLCIPSQLIVKPIGSPGTPANLWGIFALVWWTVATVGGLNPVRGLTPLRLALGFFAAAVLASYAAAMFSGWYAPADIRQSTDELWTLVAVTPEELRAKMISAADRGLLSLAGWSGILLVTAEGLRRWSDLDRLVSWIVRCGAFVAGLGIVQYFSGFDIAALFTIPGLSANSEFGAVDTRSVLNRVAGTAAHPIEFGVVMAAVFVLALHRSLHSRGSIGSWLLTGMIGVALPMSVSRSGILAVGVALLVVWLSWPRAWKVRALLAFPFAVVGLRLVAPGLVGTIRSLFTNLLNDPSIIGRTDDYGAVLAIYGDHPWLGRGLFTFIPRYYRILDNQGLMTLVELGLLGLVALVVLLGTAFLLARRAHRLAPRAPQQQLAAAVSAALAGVTLSFLTFDALGFPMVAGMTFLLLGLAGAVHTLAQRSRQPVRAAGGSQPSLAATP